MYILIDGLGNPTGYSAGSYSELASMLDNCPDDWTIESVSLYVRI